MSNRLLVASNHIMKQEMFGIPKLPPKTWKMHLLREQSLTFKILQMNSWNYLSKVCSCVIFG